MINVHNLHKQIASVNALNGTSFVAKDGEITGLLGPNGAGKTTCLRTILGLLSADEGSVEIDNITVAKQPFEAKQRLGLFPDPFGLYERLTVREYVRFFAELHKVPAQLVEEYVQQAIDSLNMQDIADRRCKGFSQGQRMKTALAQAIVHKPKNIILDEPTRGLDVMSTRQLRQLLLKLKAQGHCILFSSHVMQEVSAICDKVVVMAGGTVKAYGTPLELCQMTNQENLEEAFITLIGSAEGIAS